VPSGLEKEKIAFAIGDLEIIHGFEDRTFRSDQPITKIEGGKLPPLD